MYKYLKHIVVTLLITNTQSVCFSQDFFIFKDTLCNFEIGVPVGWKYLISEQYKLELIALRQKENDGVTPRENFNVNYIATEDTSLNLSYIHFINTLEKTDGFEIIEQGEKVIWNRKYKYLIENHNNTINGMKMVNYVFFGNKEGKLLILTMVTIAENFKKYRALFDSVAESLKY